MTTISNASPLILGSASPRRKDLLCQLRIPIEVVSASAEEGQIFGELPEEYLRRVVRNKMDAVGVLLGRHQRAHSAVLVADTIVLLDGEVLGKPADARDAQRLLRRLVGRVHKVLTRYSLRKADQRDVAFERTVESKVRMRAASDEEIRRYAASGEGLDKAGAYAVQGLGSFLVAAIDGSWSNVVGLPVCELVSDLHHAGLIRHFPLDPP